MKINTNSLTEKGLVKTSVRNAIASYVAEHRDVFSKAVASKNGYYVSVEDNEGNTIYINFEVSVSTKCIADRAPKAKKQGHSDSPISFE